MFQMNQTYPHSGRAHLHMTHKTIIAQTDANENKNVEEVSEIPEYQRKRSERYALRTVATKILPKSKVCNCHKIPIAGYVEVRSHNESKKAFFTGLSRCGLLWVCPVCAPIIAERRSKELLIAMKNAEVLGYRIGMLTLTFSHKFGDDLGGSLRGIKRAWAKMIEGRAYKTLAKRIGLVGHVRALETTYNLNGFHPHFHVLMFDDGTVSHEEIEEALYPMWLSACKRAGIGLPHREHGIKLQNGEKANQYVTWGLQSELAKGHLKKSRGAGKSPFDLLRDVLETGNETSANLFRIYARELKGSRQLVWSTGLRAKLGLDVEERTDEELVAEEDIQNSTVVAVFSTLEWRAIRYYDLQAEILNIAENNPWVIRSFVNFFAEKYLKKFPPKSFDRKYDLMCESTAA